MLSHLSRSDYLNITIRTLVVVGFLGLVEMLGKFLPLFLVLRVPVPVGLDEIEQFVVAERISENEVNEFMMNQTLE